MRWRPMRYIKFPFFVIEPNSQTTTNNGITDIVIKMQEDLTKVLVDSNNQMKIFGDIEVVTDMSLSQSP